MDKSHIKNPMNIYLVRHGMSLHNVFDQYMQGKLTLENIPPEERGLIISITTLSRKFENPKFLKFDMRLADPALSQWGVEQSKKWQNKANALDIKYVFVSPLYRAMLTSKILFETHPHKENIKFIAHPLIRETISSMNDVPAWTLRKVKKEFEKIPNMHYDFSLLDELPMPDCWFIYTLQEPDRSKLLEKIQKEGQEKHLEIIQEAMLAKKVPLHKKHHCKLETYENSRQRGKQFIEFIQKFIKEKGIKPEQVAVVSHSSFLCHMTSTEFNEYGRVKVFNKPDFSMPYPFDLNTLINPKVSK